MVIIAIQPCYDHFLHMLNSIKATNLRTLTVRPEMLIMNEELYLLYKFW